MISVGNDIVSLIAVDMHRTADPRFYSKFLTASELSLYHDLPTGEIMFVNFVWLLWSIKEAAYKYQKRIEPELIFSPSKIEVSSLHLPYGKLNFDEDYEFIGVCDGLIKGCVSIGSAKIKYRSAMSTHWIASIVNNDENFKQTRWQVKKIANDSYELQSTKTREILVQALGSNVEGDVTFAKNQAGYPIALVDGAESNFIISFAHHGCYVSYIVKEA